jgi:hypothetical protein
VQGSELGRHLRLLCLAAITTVNGRRVRLHGGCARFALGFQPLWEPFAGNGCSRGSAEWEAAYFFKDS